MAALVDILPQSTEITVVPSSLEYHYSDYNMWRRSEDFSLFG